MVSAARSAAICLCAMLAIIQASAQPLAPAGKAKAIIRQVETDAEGTGTTREAAISRALSTALAQETGVDISALSITASDTHSDMAALKFNAATNARSVGVVAPPGDTKSQAAAAAKDSSENGVLDGVTKRSGGRIDSYRVVSVLPADGGGFTAKVHAVLALYKRETSPADSRRRITVGDFTGEHGGLSEGLHDRLLLDLTQSRRFIVVDRSHDQDYAREMAIVGSTEAAPAERARAGQVLGADYVLTGKFQVATAHTTGHAAHTTTATLDLTGEQIASTTASTLRTTRGSVTVEFELIEVATRQITMADRLTIAGNNLDAVAGRITDTIADAIYPARLINSGDPDALVVNAGGRGMSTGRVFRLMLQGAEMFDPYTHESLGRTDREVGTIEISDVRPKFSYARLIAGQVPADGDVVLRPVEVHEPVKVAVSRKRPYVQPAAAVVQDNGVRLPFDR